jgi:hypothetical protein
VRTMWKYHSVVINSFRQSCRCQLPSSSNSFYRCASTTSIPIQDSLIIAATKVIHNVESNQDGGIESNKRKREIEGLQRALLDVQEGQEVSSPSPSPS